MFLQYFFSAILFFLFTSLEAATIFVTNNSGATAPGSLGAAILESLAGDTIDCSPLPGSTVISLTQPLPAIVQNLAFIGKTADGTSVTIDGTNGGNGVQAFSIASGIVSFDSFHIQNCRSKGGNGGTNGGGGIGGGGGLYVHNGAIVMISNLSFIGNSAVGGNGGSTPAVGSAGGGGGGGFGGGDGGVGSARGGGGGHPGGGQGGGGNSLYGTSGAGGGGATTQAGGSSGIHTGGVPSSGRGGGGAGAGGDGGNATSTAAGPGGIGIGADSLFGGGGGGGGGTPPGVGTGAGGGGGSASFGPMANGADGGILGGGGGGSGGPNAISGGNGGFGAGGGGGGGAGGGASQPSVGGLGGLYGGNGGAGTSGGTQRDGCGGGGAGLGGAVFVQNSGSLIINSGFSASGNIVTAGLGGTFTGANSGQNGQAKGPDFFVRSPGSLIFNNADSLTISSDIESDGAATLTKQNTGTLTLSGVNTYTGLTSLNEGILVVNGTVAGALYVASSALLKGTGTIQGLVTVNGTLAPGNSIGTINVDSLSIASNGTLEIEIDLSGNTSIVNVTNGVTLDPNSILIITANPGTYSTSTIYPPFVIANSITGKFGTIENNISNLNANVSYSGTALIIQLIPPAFPSSTLEELTGNSAKIGAYLNSLPLTFIETATYKNLTLLSPDALNQALKTISPSRNSFSTFISINTIYSLNNILDSRFTSNRFLKRQSSSSEIAFADCHLESRDEMVMHRCQPSKRALKMPPPLSPPPSEKKYNVWVDGFGALAKQNAQEQNPEFSFQTWGFVTGFEVNFSSIDTGVVLAYAGSGFRDEDDFGSGSLNAGYGGLYVTANYYNFYLNGTLWNGCTHNKNRRHIFFPTYSEEAKSTYNVYQADGHVEFGYDFRYGGSTLSGMAEPFVSLDYALNSEPSFNEQGNSVFNMHQEGRFASMLRTELGLHNDLIQVLDSGFIQIKGKLSYINKVPFDVGNITANIEGEPGSFSVVSLTKTQNLVSPGVGFVYRAYSGSYITLFYDGEFGSGYSYNQFSLKLGKYF